MTSDPRHSRALVPALVLALLCAVPVGTAPAEPGAHRRPAAHPLPGLGDEDGILFAAGLALFDKLWVAAPASTLASDGLGPLFSARACAVCHKDGAAGTGPQGDRPGPGMTLRLRDGAGAPDPVYGRQIQTRGIAAQPGEARVTLDWETHEVALAGGETVTLRRPLPRLTGMSDGAMAPGTRMSLRNAPPVYGLGLVEAIPEADILAGADPEDSDGDGISGRANRTADGRLGRFGWKAINASLSDQAADAFADDIGLSTSRHPDGWGDCTAAQPDCRARPDGSSPSGLEVPDDVLKLVTDFSANLAPLAAAPGDPRGADLFENVGCAACHRPGFVTGGDAPRQRARQPLWPYSDFLLHDMGPGLADDVAEGQAKGGEWRTAPLWGMGAQGGDPARPPAYLHDGRARTPLEAILWHDGEARSARDHVVRMSPGDRAALLRFLDSL